MATIRDIVMYDDVGFDATHKHCLDFPSETERYNYFSNLRDKTFFRDANYNKTENMLNLECEWETGLKFSYCSLTYNNKKMFFFVTGCKVVNEKVTGFQLVMDMWQTFLFDFKVGEGMITREHVDRWDREGNILWKRGVSEDLISNYTEVFTTDFRGSPSFRDETNNVNFYVSMIYLVHLKSNIEVEGENPHSYYETVYLPLVWGVKSDGSICVVTLLEGKHHSTEHTEPTTSKYMTAQNCLVGDVFSSLEIDPKSVISITYQPISDQVMDFRYSSPTFSYTDNTVHIYCNDSIYLGGHGVYSKYITQGETHYWSLAWISFNPISEPYGSKPYGVYKKLNNLIQNRPVKPSNNDNYSATHEPEMFKEPYIKRSIVDCDGSLLMDCSDVTWFNANNIYYSYINENQGVDLSVLFLDRSDDSVNIKMDEFNKKASMGLATRILGGQIDVPSDEWKSYTVSQRETDREMLQSTINQQAVTSSIGSIVGMGGISGMAGSGKGSGLGFNLAQGMAGAGIGAVMGVAGWGANQYFGWEQQEIKEKAIRNQPNNLLRSGSSDGQIKLMISCQSYTEKKCNDSAYNQASNRYHKYGYRVDMMGVPNIKTRKHFNFVQTSQIRIEGSMNQAIRDNIADIFNNGVTIWHGEYISKESGTNKFITDYSKENIERSLI